ncbi:MAG: hypothetical protein DBX47_00865 [Clostridiales bacterium]|nr:MAG: hypothetical protein DBX47_00865 [Clostridiales bacterium]
MKKRVIFFTLIISLIATLSFSLAAQSLPGDANLDQKVTTTDARYVLQAAVKNRVLTGEAFTNADFDNDGNISTTDARKTLETALTCSYIEIKSMPDKTTYYVGDLFIPTGATITYTNSGVQQEVLVSASLISGFDSSTPGLKTVTVTYQGCTAKFNINVVEKTTVFKLNGIFNHNMVLQRQSTVPVYGLASDGITVTVDFNGQVKSCISSGGKWRIDLDSMEANSVGAQLTVTTSSGEKAQYNNILVGDVWLCSGQSNMYWRVQDIPNSTEKLKIQRAASNTNIRSFWANQVSATTPQNDIERQLWKISSSSGVLDQSAYAISFAQGLQETLGIPIGIATLCQGSTSITSWIEGGNYYNAMIASVMPFKFKGVLWWQGETDCLKDANFETNYPKYFTSMVNSWRSGFENPVMPFLQTQIANYAVDNDTTSFGSWVQMQHLQPRMIDENNKIYTVCNFDNFDSLSNIHPNEKKAAGTRAANLALEKVYGLDVYGAAPRFLKAEKTANGVLVTFTDVHDGLTANTSLGTKFSACGSNGVFVNVSYSIVSANQILLNTNSITNVKTIRYISNSATAPVIFGGGVPLFGFSYSFY